MREWDYMERRKLPRYDIALSSEETDLGSLNSFNSVTRDISEHGVGIISGNKIDLNSPLDVCLVMPDTQEKIHAQGHVIWVSPIGPGQYRAGIYLGKLGLKPIPLVLRMIKVQLRSRYYQ